MYVGRGYGNTEVILGPRLEIPGLSVEETDTYPRYLHVSAITQLTSIAAHFSSQLLHFLLKFTAYLLRRNVAWALTET